MATILRGRLHYAWIIFGVTFLALLASAGVRSTPGILIVPLEQEFGWDRATVSLAVSINLILYGLFGPFAAAIMDRIGMRRVMVGALGLVALAIGLTTVMREPWQLYLLWGVVVGISTGSMATGLGAMIANRWFVQRRGLVMGLLTASGATGQLIFLPLMASLVVAYGWRAAVLLVAGVALLVAPVVLIFMRAQPRDVGLRPFGEDPQAASPELPPVSGNPFSTAVGTLMSSLRSRDFRFLAASFFICGASTNGLIGTHLIPASMEHGIPEVTAASMLALIGIFDLVGTTVSGLLSDRYDSRWLLCLLAAGIVIRIGRSPSGRPVAAPPLESAPSPAG